MATPTNNAEVTDDNTIVRCRPSVLSIPGFARRSAVSADDEIEAQFVLPGGGVFFFWQLGAMEYIQTHYDLARVAMAGASAGALTAACAATNINFHDLVTNIVNRFEESAVWQRQLGLVGIMGKITEEALDDLLPEDSHHKLVKGHVSVLVKPMSGERCTKISKFNSRKSVVEVLTATSHIPFVANGKLTAMFRGKAYMDGAVFGSEEELIDASLSAPVIRIRYREDPYTMKGYKSILDCVKTPGKKEIWTFFENGYRHAQRMDEQGRFSCITKKSSTSGADTNPRNIPVGESVTNEPLMACCHGITDEGDSLERIEGAQIRKKA